MPIQSARLVTVTPAFALRAELVDHPGVARTIAVAQDQTLEQLHEALRMAFGWADAHLYSFWPSGEFWDDGEEYTAPFEVEERGPNARSANVAIGELDLRKGKKIAYLFDYGDEWRVALEVVDSWEIEDGAYPMLVEAEGSPPQQYEAHEEDE